VANTYAHRLWLSTLPSGIESTTQDFGGVSLAGGHKLARHAPNRAVEELVGGHIIASRVHSLGCPLTTSSMGVKAMQTTLRGILLVALVAVVHGDEEDGHELGANEVCACVCGAWCVWFSRPPNSHDQLCCGRRHTRCPSAVDWWCVLYRVEMHGPDV
jgi:hypothetical protein